MEVLEQIGHFAWAAAVLILYIIIPIPLLNGFIAGVMVALPRELIDQWPIERPLDTVLDLLFFGLGGLTISAIHHWVLS